jgi:hypothetical protein
MRTSPFPCSSLFFSSLFLALGTSLVSCAVAGEPPNPGAPRGELALDEEFLDEAARAPARELEASVDGLGLRVSPIVQIEERDGAVIWRLEGRSTVALGSVASWVPDDAFGAAELTGPRSFAITFREPHEQNTVASGMPLFLTVSQVSGARAEAAIWLRPRLEVGAGAAGSASLSGRIQPYATMKPVWVADDELGNLEYRGKVAVAAGWTLEPGAEPAPRLTALENHRVRLAWSFNALAATLARPAPQLQLRAHRGSDVATRAVTLEVRAVRLGLTREDPREVWPTLCEPSVRACLLALPSLETDTEACGSYRQVLACGGPAAFGGARERPPASSELL